VVEGTLQGTEVERGGQRQETLPVPGAELLLESRRNCTSSTEPVASGMRYWEVATGLLHRAFLTWVIAAARADRQAFVRPSAGFHANRAIPADTLRRGWDIADGVLIADIASHRAADFIDIDERWGEKRHAAGAR
jgi:hypothetical protein